MRRAQGSFRRIPEQIASQALSLVAAMVKTKATALLNKPIVHLAVAQLDLGRLALSGKT